jgi:ribosomal protein S18 acetylase RimI-like enzyme
MSSDVTGVRFRAFVPEDAPRMAALQQRCLDVCHDTSLLPEGFYFAPGFDEGRNIICAVGEAGAHLGHAMIYPSYVHQKLGTWMVWLDLRVDPDFDRAEALKAALLARIKARAYEVQAALDKPAMLYAAYFDQGRASIDDLKQRGFKHIESYFQLRRDLSEPIPDLPQPQGVRVRTWRLATEADQRRYLEAYDASFEDEGKSLEQLRHFLKADLWGDGATLTAFDGDRVVGSVAAYYQPDRAKNTEGVGLTEYVFVRPEWRRRGLARYLVAAAMRYLKARGLAYATLEVGGDNAPARALYESLGYDVLHEELCLAMPLDEEVAR